MNRGNLIPAARRANKARRGKVRQWTAISLAYLVVMVAVSAGTVWFLSSEPFDPAALGQARGDIATSNAALAALRGQAVLLRGELKSAQEVSQQPDWSILLAAVAKQCGGEIVLSGCELSKSGATIVLRMEGVGLSTKAIASFVLRLQDVPVLQQVKLLQTSSKQVLGVDAYSFQLSCVVSSEGGGRHE